VITLQVRTPERKQTTQPECSEEGDEGDEGDDAKEREKARRHGPDSTPPGQAKKDR
jgi:hypothetical protein